ncbi:MAG TPA: nuclear transport factor 2 family protein [Chryseosolibacter sp.]
MKTQQASETAVIAQAIELEYFHGLFNGNVELLRKIFHPNTLLFGDVKNQPYAKHLDEYLDGVSNRVAPKDSGKPFESEILAIDVINSIAVAKVRLQMYDFNYYDLLSFHKLDNKWRIVNKLLTHVDTNLK